MKQSFSSRGIKYHAVDKLSFCDLYYPEHNTTDEYISDCLDAEMGEFDPSTVIWKVIDGEYYFYISEGVTHDDIFNAVVDSLEGEEREDMTLRDAYRWAHDVANNFVYTQIKDQYDYLSEV